jgi:hypothetical protein
VNQETNGALLLFAGSTHHANTSFGQSGDQVKDKQTPSCFLLVRSPDLPITRLQDDIL